MLDDCIKFANDNKVCFVATAEGDQPRVRAFMMWYADDTGFYFSTRAQKSVCQQLIKNPKTEVCFYAPAPPPNPGTMMRVRGEVEFLNDSELKTRLLEELPFLKEMGVSGPDDPELALFRIFKGEAYFWTIGEKMQEKEYGRVTF